jgi:hypothetical protein
VSISKNEPETGRELTMVMTQEAASSRYCPFSMGGDRTFCHGSGCQGWRWKSLNGEPQHDARVATGYCGVVAHTNV